MPIVWGLVAAVVIAVVVAIVLALKGIVVAARLREKEAQVEDLSRRATVAEDRANALAKYQGIADAEARAASIVTEAQRRGNELIAEANLAATALRDEAEALRQKASAEGESLLEAAKEEARALKKQADLILTNADDEAGRIIETAKRRAQEIAGEAYQAMAQAKELEQTAKAMKNVIEGYGDAYIVPTMGLLDELGEEFGYTEAGAKLKAARERMRTMIKSGTAAQCEYVEENRRETAVAFVVDAFNGKVDSILADVRHDNYGVLEQKIKDAYQLVNNLGKAFRDARITETYLQARLDELRWAVVVNELKLREREEQRLIKERIREEERAQKEFERAMREAEKEEESLRKAMDKAQAAFDKASDAQKAKYEDQLRELEAKLKAAEEKNQRALSMAQQTKTGHVYVISNVGSFGEDVYKIGLTRRLEPLDRVKELGDASVPFDFDVHAMIHSTDAPTLERELHKVFVRRQINKVNPKKEFFRVAIAEIRREVERLGLQATWTMAAACKEYKETQVIENRMSEQGFEETRWIETQLREHDAALKEAVVREAEG